MVPTLPESSLASISIVEKQKIAASMSRIALVVEERGMRCPAKIHSQVNDLVEGGEALMPLCLMRVSLRRLPRPRQSK